MTVPIACCLSFHLHGLGWWDRNNPTAVRSSFVSLVVMKQKCQMQICSLLRREKPNPLCSGLMCCKRELICNNHCPCPSTELWHSGHPLYLGGYFIGKRSFSSFFSSWLLVKSKCLVFLGVIPRLTHANLSLDRDEVLLSQVNASELKFLRAFSFQFHQLFFF